MTTNNQRLDLFTEQLRNIEKKNIGGAVEEGRLLTEAKEVCSHGEYVAWIVRNHGWSHATTLRKRRAFEFANTCDDFESLNLSVSALYYVADLSLSAGPIETAALRKSAQKAIIRAARKRRVTRAVAEQIFEKIRNPPIDPVEGETPLVSLGSAQPIQPDDDIPAANDDDEPATHEPIDDDVGVAIVAEDGAGNLIPGLPIPGLLAAMLRAILQKYPVVGGEWPVAVKDVGQVDVRRVADLMNAVVSDHCDGAGLKSIADRAEAKSKKRA
jgi:hypothetical protein